jgi:hypothetical protein
MTRNYAAGFLSALILSASLLVGQNATINGPAIQYIFDPGSETIRAIVGAPGSAYLSKSVSGTLQFGSVAPNGLSAITVAGGTSELIANLSQGSAPLALASSPLALTGAIENPDHILWAADSSGAVLFSSRGHALQFISGIKQQPVVEAKIDLSTFEFSKRGAAGKEPGTGISVKSIVLLAVDATASYAAVAIGNAVYLVQQGASPQLLTTVDSANAAAFGSDGSLYIADGTAGQIWAIKTPQTNPSPQLLPAPQGGLSRPVAIAVAGNFLYAAGTAGNRITVYDLTTLQRVTQLDLDSVPSSLQPFTATSFLVNARRSPTDPVLLLETSPTANVVFIPSGNQTGANQ